MPEYQSLIQCPQCGAEVIMSGVGNTDLSYTLPQHYFKGKAMDGWLCTKREISLFPIAQRTIEKE